MRVRPFVRPAVALLALAASACFRSETPAGPSLPPSTNGVVHVVGQNASTLALGLTSWDAGLYATSVAPGGTVEMMRWNTAVQGAAFLVFEPTAERPYFSPVALVAYDVVSVPATASAEFSALVRVSRDASGTVSATSDRPDVVRILAVTKP